MLSVGASPRPEPSEFAARGVKRQKVKHGDDVHPDDLAAVTREASRINLRDDGVMMSRDVEHAIAAKLIKRASDLRTADAPPRSYRPLTIQAHKLTDPQYRELSLRSVSAYCHAGDPEYAGRAQFRLASHLEHKPTPEFPKELAHAWYRSAARDGNVFSKTMVTNAAYTRLLADGRPRDLAAVRAEIGPFAQGSYPSPLAQHLLAAALEKTGTPQNITEASILYRRAADVGHSPSQVALAQMIKRGDVPGRDATDAELLLNDAAEAGNDTALDLLNGHRQGTYPIPIEQQYADTYNSLLRPENQRSAELHMLGSSDGHQSAASAASSGASSEPSSEASSSESSSARSEASSAAEESSASEASSSPAGASTAPSSSGPASSAPAVSESVSAASTDESESGSQSSVGASAPPAPSVESSKATSSEASSRATPASRRSAPMDLDPAQASSEDTSMASSS